jgi:hypothetical protein
MICFKCSWQNSAGLMGFIHSLGSGCERFFLEKYENAWFCWGMGLRKILK